MLAKKWWIAVPSILLSFILGSFLVDLLLGAEIEQKEPLYEIQLESGRTFHGVLSARTSDTQLSISSGDSHIKIIRSIQWERVQQIFLDEKQVSPERLRNLASMMRLPGEAEHQKKRNVYSNKIPAGGQDSKTNSSRLSSLEVDAHLAQWDNDLNYDGLLLNWFASDQSGNPILLHGKIEAELYTTQRHSFNAVPQGNGYRYTRIGRWVYQINGTDSIQLPFQAANPEDDLNLGESGYLKVKFILPGSGVVQRQIEPIRIRRFSPARDSQELRRIKYK
ncbi:MAG: hypothetical protein COA78_33480 [Blastopirellula sp.]|nr:MAG: hypothetical protein COA78_33480 [Blastopirellula sp.]